MLGLEEHDEYAPVTEHYLAWGSISQALRVAGAVRVELIDALGKSLDSAAPRPGPGSRPRISASAWEMHPPKPRSTEPSRITLPAAWTFSDTTSEPGGASGELVDAPTLRRAPS
jgi:hypothetical protein